MDHFSDCVTSNKTPLTAGEEGLKDMKLIASVYQSAASHAPVKV
jgi:predicted dehydrogenase